MALGEPLLLFMLSNTTDCNVLLMTTIHQASEKESVTSKGVKRTVAVSNNDERNVRWVTSVEGSNWQVVWFKEEYLL